MAREKIGHKGIGKSAMLAIAAHEDLSNHQLAISLRPDDIAEVDLEQDNINAQIRAWKDGFRRIIGGKVFEFFSINKAFNHNTHASTWTAIATDIGKTIAQLLPNNGAVLDESKKAILDEFCRNNVIRVYIDDLDRGWNATNESVTRMSAMLNAVRDISREFQNIRFVISLRSDVFYLVRTSDESTDKLESSCVWSSWTNHEILAMLIKRIRTYFELDCPPDEVLVKMDQKNLAYDLRHVMSPVFNGQGTWEKIPTYRMLMTLIRRRPRDLVKLCTLAARHAYDNGRPCIETEDFNEILSRYSQDRLQDTINEYKSELANIQALLESMKPSQRKIRLEARNGKCHKFTLSGSDMLSKIESIRQSNHFRFFGTQVDADSKTILGFLYKIGFVTARKELPTGEIIRHFFEDQNYVCSRFTDFGCSWEIHPAYRWALAPYDRNVTDEIDCLLREE